MGQQQLLLIVLGVIIVGIAVVVGINVFTASSLDANKNALVSDLTNLASMAQQYYRKPAALGGGDQAFTDWTSLPALLRTANMSADVTAAVGADEVTLTATGTENDADGNPIVVTMTFNKDEITETTFSDAN